MSQRHASHIRPSRRARPLRCWSICLLRLSRKTHVHPRLHLQLELDVRPLHLWGPEGCREHSMHDRRVLRLVGAFSVAERPVRCSVRACALSSVYRTGIGAWTRFADTFIALVQR